MREFEFPIRVMMPRRLTQVLQFDRPLAFALAARIWQGISGPVTIAFLIESVSLREQGVYYGLVSIVGIQALFELGLLNVLVSHAGHQSAMLNERGGGVQKPGDGQRFRAERAIPEAALRMRELIRGAGLWFGGAAVLYVLVALMFGWRALAGTSDTVQWKLPLLTLVPLAAVPVFLSPKLAILEGAGYRDVIYRFRFWQAVAGSLGVWAALLAGWKLWALVVATLVQVICSLYIVYWDKANFFARFCGIDSRPAKFFWWHNVVPGQWRMAAASIAVHLATQFFTVVVLAFHSEAEAAPLGMTLSMTMAIQMLSLAWVQTKFSVVSAYHGAGDREAAGTMWRHTAMVSTGILAAALGALLAAVTLLPSLAATFPAIDREIVNRFLMPHQLVVLSIGCIANHLVAVQSFYVMSRVAAPLVGASVVGFLTTAVAVWIGGYWFSTDGVLIAYAATMSFVTLPLHTLAYLRFRVRRADPPLQT